MASQFLFGGLAFSQFAQGIEVESMDPYVVQLIWHIFLHPDSLVELVDEEDAPSEFTRIRPGQKKLLTLPTDECSLAFHCHHVHAPRRTFGQWLSGLFGRRTLAPQEQWCEGHSGPLVVGDQFMFDGIGAQLRANGVMLENRAPHMVNVAYGNRETNEPVRFTMEPEQTCPIDLASGTWFFSHQFTIPIREEQLEEIGNVLQALFGESAQIPGQAYSPPLRGPVVRVS